MTISQQIYEIEKKYFQFTKNGNVYVSNIMCITEIENLLKQLKVKYNLIQKSENEKIYYIFSWIENEKKDAYEITIEAGE